MSVTGLMDPLQQDDVTFSCGQKTSVPPDSGGGTQTFLAEFVRYA